jgi:membrane protease YdiL (CAAX protease family)
MNTLQARPALSEDLRLAALFGLAGVFAALALIPYLQLLMPDAFAQAQARLHVPMWALLAIQSLQAFFLVTLLALVGLRLGHPLGLGAPWLRALMTKAPRQAQPWWLAAACGVAAGVVVVALDSLFRPHMPAALQPLPAASAQVHALAGFLASFYGDIVEELELRLFLATLVAWLLYRIAGRRELRWHLAFAVVFAALLFGAGHLPAAAKIWPLDAVVVVRTLALNGLAGLVFGWFYVKHGLESAMLSHFCADLVLHVGAPLLLGSA